MKHVKMRVEKYFSNMVIFQFAKCEFLRLLEGIQGIHPLAPGKLPLAPHRPGRLQDSVPRLRR